MDTSAITRTKTMAEAIRAMAARLMPQAPQIRTGLAHVQIEMQRGELLDPAIGNLETALHTDRFDLDNSRPLDKEGPVDRVVEGLRITWRRCQNDGHNVAGREA